MKFLKMLAKGILIGAGSIAPGVSGGAIAIIFGLYEKIINSINNFFKDIKNNALFLINIGIGVAIGIVLFSSIQLTLLKHYALPTMFTFAGLVIGTIPRLLKTANKKGFNYYLLIPFFLALGIGLFFCWIDNTSISDNIQETELIFNFRNIIYLFLIGIVLSGSLVIPGISGTVLLFLIGVYGLVMNAIASIKDIFLLPFASKDMILAFLDKMYILIPLGLGLVVGTLLFSRLMEYLINKHYSITYYAIVGFVIGSLPELIPIFNQAISINRTLILSIILLLVASYVSFYLNKFAKD